MQQRAPSSFAAPLDRPAWQCYGFAVLMLLAAQIVRWLLHPYTGNALPLSTMYVGVAFAVWFGGWKPAAAIAVAGYFVALYLFVPPRFTFKSWDDSGPMRAVLYTASCTITIYLCESIRRARKRHAASEAKVMSLLENMREAFLAVDAEWRITFLNRSAIDSFGQSREALIARQLWDVLPACVGTPAEEGLRRAMRERTSVQFETNTFVPGAWHAVTATRVADELSIFVQDISAQRSHLEQLERLVDDRTAALQRVVADLETFSYTLVHDMRAPLRSITGFAELLAVDHAPKLDAEGKNHLTRIQRSAARMDQLIVDILAYSQLSRTQPELRGVDLEVTLREILRSHTDFNVDKVDIEIEGPLPVVRGTNSLLTQCFSNLLHNAVKFVNPGLRPRIRIASRVNGEVARVEITDNGIGIAAEATARIFEPFRRENAHYDGTGIGLAIVQKVVDQLQGRVGVESKVGQGSCFWVELKTCTPAPSATAAEESSHVLV
jgi:PAS domain S-box-containing protein